MYGYRLTTTVGAVPVQDKPDLAALQQMVGGWIEEFTLQGSAVTEEATILMILNENGKYEEGLSPNVKATHLAWGHGLPGTDYIMGDVVVVASVAGELVPLPEDWAELLGRM